MEKNEVLNNFFGNFQGTIISIIRAANNAADHEDNPRDIYAWV